MTPFSQALIVTIALSIGAVACQTSPDIIDPPESVIAQSEDGVTIYGYPLGSSIDGDSPIILLFHQGGSNARGEYSELALWLQAEGFRTLAWDLRSGGDWHGGDNLTKAGLSDSVPAGFCDAYPDLETALTYLYKRNPSAKIFAWGSSYSAALVFQLAAKHSDKIDGILAFSPASGPPLEGCRATRWADQVTAPALALSPGSEMERESVQRQRAALEAVGIDYLVIDDGVHGSSMLLDNRTEADMSEARAKIIAWLKAHSS